MGREGIEKVLAYINRSERPYCVTRRKFLAVAVRHFKYYLCGEPFTMRTDHAALQWLMSFKEPEGQVARWMEELQSYNFTVVHIAGSSYNNTDALSHHPCAVVTVKIGRLGRGSCVKRMRQHNLHVRH